MSILATLKERTQPHHERVEANLGVMDPGLTRDAYRVLLARFRGFHLPVERRLDALAAWEALGLRADERRKTSWLEADLRALGMDEDALARLPVCSALPALETVDHALGCLYVLEGATLGGAFISRHLARTLGIDAGSGGAFFASYGERRGPMWKSFGRALESYVERRGGEEEILAGARDTFITLDHWLTRPS
ncbi:MAG TPA: biliverdin-producing heme oxygenase [Longimicrobium sp.]|nr:biliverdin-producing heme oxygenase [Longimicrobium sp.]